MPPPLPAGQDLYETAHERFGKNQFDAQRLENRLPQQNNHCDCGLFLLTFIEFFCYGAPKRVVMGFTSMKHGVCEWVGGGQGSRASPA